MSPISKMSTSTSAPIATEHQWTAPIQTSRGAGTSSSYSRSLALLNTGPLRRKIDEYSMSTDELDKLRLRRERNKLAAARCRNRRRDLTNTLLTQTEDLEDQNMSLENEINKLQKQKEQLEFLLQVHQPMCKMHDPNNPVAAAVANAAGMTSGLIVITSASPLVKTETITTESCSFKQQPIVQTSSVCEGYLHTPVYSDAPTFPTTMSLTATTPTSLGLVLTDTVQVSSSLAATPMTPGDNFAFSLDNLSMMEGYVTPVSGSCSSEVTESNSDLGSPNGTTNKSLLAL